MFDELFELWFSVPAMVMSERCLHFMGLVAKNRTSRHQKKCFKSNSKPRCFTSGRKSSQKTTSKSNGGVGTVGESGFK